MSTHNRCLRAKIRKMNTQFDYIKVPCKGGYITRTCYHDCITLTSPCNVEPLTPHFYIINLGYTGVYIFSYFCNIDCGYSSTHDLSFEQNIRKLSQFLL